MKREKMPDITHCLGDGCPMKETCYRAQAKPSMLQSYFSEVPFKDELCEYYIEIPKTNVRQPYKKTKNR